MKTKPLNLFSFFLILLLLIDTNAFHFQEHKSIKDLVPNESVAKKIAETILIPIFGKKEIRSQRPYAVELVNDSIWVVQGVVKEEIIGGGFYIEIQKRDCKILKITHGK